MTHKHIVSDTDNRFVINLKDRTMKSEHFTKAYIIQHDHNSERFTFVLPQRYVEGHDMLECNKVEVHFNNIDKVTKAESRGVYEVVDLHEGENDTVVCSWLISSNATKYVGKLAFVVRFACMTGDTIDYQWFTAVNESMSVSNGIFNSDETAYTYADALEKWKNELFGAGDSVMSDIAAAKTEAIVRVEERASQLAAQLPQDYTELNDKVQTVEKSVDAVMFGGEYYENKGFFEFTRSSTGTALLTDWLSLRGTYKFNIDEYYLLQIRTSIDGGETYQEMNLTGNDNYLVTSSKVLYKFALFNTDMLKEISLEDISHLSINIENSLNVLTQSIDGVVETNNLIVVKKVKRVAVGNFHGDAYVYATNGNAVCYAIELKCGQRVALQATNINRCRVARFKTRFNDIQFAHTYPIEGDGVIYGEILEYDDSLTEYTLDHTCTGQVETIVMYLGLDIEPIVNIKDMARGVASELVEICEFEAFEKDYSCAADTPYVLDITSDEFLDTFYNQYLGYHNGGNYMVTKQVLGKDETGVYDVWEYDFRPKNYTRTILLTSGLHSNETPASFGLALWVRDLMNETNDTFKWIRENVRIKVIPIANPWGFNQNPKTYGNANGVNPNRNFNDWENTWATFPVYSANPSDSNYNEWNVKGSEPYSEAETRILRDWLRSNSTAEFWIDCHTGYGNYNGENWIIYTSSNPNKEKILGALSLLENRIKEKYGTTPTSYKQVDLDSFIKGRFGTDVCCIPTMVIEQSGNNNSWGTDINNEPIKITEYATYINAYVVAQLKD